MTFNLGTDEFSNNMDNTNIRSPHLDLDSLYGQAGVEYLFNDNKFIINSKNHDLIRNSQGKAIIPDPRNDENYIIGQLHYLFQLFHNKLIDEFSNKNIQDVFKLVRREVTFYYQWIIVNDYLSRLIDNDVLDSIFKYGTKFYSPTKYEYCIPREFAIAAFRYGHYTINNYYTIAYDFKIPEEKLHHYTGGILPDYVIDWSNFFNVVAYKSPTYSKKIEATLAQDLNNMNHLDKPADMPFDKNSLFLRNLLRGKQSKLPSGQDLAKAMGLEPISRDIMIQHDRNGNLERNGFLENTPLLIYILKEAEIFKGGTMLTGVGGILIAEVMLGLLFEDKNSYFNSKDNWKPTLPSEESGQFLMGDLIRYVYS